jgi:hypothetical protein
VVRPRLPGAAGPGISDAYLASKLLESKEVIRRLCPYLVRSGPARVQQSGTVLSYLMPSYEGSTESHPVGHHAGRKGSSRVRNGAPRRLLGALTGASSHRFSHSSGAHRWHFAVANFHGWQIASLSRTSLNSPALLQPLIRRVALNLLLCVIAETRRVNLEAA